MSKPIRKLLVANRGEICIRVMRAAVEMGIKTVAIYAHEDRFALHRFKADESYQVGSGQKPIAASRDIPDIIRIARAAGVDAIHPGYGFLSENPAFAEACAAAGITFIGPSPAAMLLLGDKAAGRLLAGGSGVPGDPGYDGAARHDRVLAEYAARIGFPLLVKAAAGGGGRG